MASVTPSGRTNGSGRADILNLDERGLAVFPVLAKLSIVATEADT
jgi:hypothetical protein